MKSAILLAATVLSSTFGAFGAPQTNSTGTNQTFICLITPDNPSNATGKGHGTTSFEAFEAATTDCEAKNSGSFQICHDVRNECNAGGCLAAIYATIAHDLTVFFGTGGNSMDAEEAAEKFCTPNSDDSSCDLSGITSLCA